MHSVKCVGSSVKTDSSFGQPVKTIILKIYNPIESGQRIQGRKNLEIALNYDRS